VQWSPTNVIYKVSLTGTIISQFTPAVSPYSARSIGWDGTNLLVGCNQSSNVTELVKYTTGGVMVGSPITSNTAVGWYMDGEVCADAPAGNYYIVDNVGNTIKRLDVGVAVTVAASIPAPAASPDVAEGIAYDGEDLWNCGAYASAGLIWRIDDGFVAADPRSPAAPSAFTVGNNGLTLTASLAWTNPTTTVQGGTLVSIDNVIVKRDGNVIATLTGTPGQVMTYNNPVPSIGSYAYQVYCTNSFGAGPPASASAWIGLDVPGAPSGVVATPGNMSYTLNWVAPTAGQHGGYWPAGSWTGQKIYANGNLVATLTGTNTSYNGTVGSAGNYTIGVAYYNTSGDGPTTNAAPVLITGPPQYTMASTPYAWVEINPAHPGGLSGTNTGLNSDDQNLGPFPIGFSFPSWSGTSFNTVRMCSNGFASFTSTLTTFTNTALPSTAGPFDLLGIYWDDMYMVNYGTAWYYTDMPNNRYIMEWDSIAHYSATSSYFTFEIILHTDGTIDYMYKEIVGGTTTPFPSATVGIQDAAGVLAMQATFDGSGPIEPARHTGIRFQPAAGVVSLDVNLTPLNPPIVVPAIGGSFSFDVSITRQVGPAAPYVVWTRIKNPNGTYTGNILGPITINTPVGVTITRNRNQNIPGGWASGVYLYLGYVNNTFVYPAMDSSAFTFTKAAVGGTGPGVWDAICSGELFPGEVGVSSPTAFSMAGAYPNPFNPSTTISFTLPEASRVTLNVFDVSGRQVAQLVNGLRAAGAHQVTFDGSSLTSGVYLYTLTAGSQTVTGKMVLLK